MLLLVTRSTRSPRSPSTTLRSTGVSTYVSLQTLLFGLIIQVLGALALFQACVPRMSKGGKFIFMSSGASPIDRIPDKEDAGYGITKVSSFGPKAYLTPESDAVQSSCNYLARYAHFENPELVVFSLSPGWVQT